MRHLACSSRSIAFSLRVVAAAAMASALSASGAQAQRANGSIGVSLEVVQPVSTQAVRIVGFSVNRAGVATVRTTAPVHGSASQIVMSSVASAGSDFELVPQRPALVRGDQRDALASRNESAESAQLSYVVNVGHISSESSDSRPVQLRIRYLAVAGT